MSTDQPIRISLEQEEDYAFKIRFEDTDLPEWLTDEPPPLGGGRGPNPSRMLLAAVANCLAASLLFALRKFKNQPGRLHAEISSQMARNEAGRWRLPRAKVVLRLADGADALSQIERVLAQFEEFCVVTQSVREGIAVDVEVQDGSGAVIHQHEA